MLLFSNGQCHSDNEEFEGFTLHIQKMTTPQLKQTDDYTPAKADWETCVVMGNDASWKRSFVLHPTIWKCASFSI